MANLVNASLALFHQKSPTVFSEQTLSLSSFLAFTDRSLCPVEWMKYHVWLPTIEQSAFSNIVVDICAIDRGGLV